ncbi:TPA: hypothetical protein DEP96_01420 [Candidatus Uhrbacteria bacterium]|nr:hypothetical protein [Candidatus Uhrbacteria bacterium]
MKKSVIIIAGALAIGMLDVILKLLAITSFKPDSEVLSWPVDLALHKNPGITGDTMIPLFVVIPLTVVIIALLVRFAWLKRVANKMQMTGAVVVAIGAMGNLVDRFINGFTTDYLIFFRLSAINLSDILIVAGAILLLYYNESIPQSTK